MKTIFIVSLLISSVLGKFTITAGNNKRILESRIRHRAKRAWSYPDISLQENSRTNTYPAGRYLMTIQSDAGETVSGIKYFVANAPDKLPQNENVQDWFEMRTEKDTKDNGKDYGALYTKKEFDREKYALWKIQLVAQLPSGSNAESPLVIGVNILDVDDNDPVLLQQSLNQQFSEKSNIGDKLFTLEYSDADDPLQGQNAVATFYKVSEVSDGVASDYLDVVQSTGAVTLKQKVDYEKVKNIELRVSMTSSGRPMVAGDNGKAVLVKVVDGNDNPPEITPVPKHDVEETKAIGTTVLTISATDKDSAAINNAAYFEIISGDSAGQWKIENVPSEAGTSFGKLVIAKNLDYEPGPRQYNLVVQAYNKKIDGTKDIEEMSKTTIQIDVIDVNEPPIFDNNNYQATVEEGTSVGAPVITITAKDIDFGGQAVTYKLVDQYGWFAIGKTSGKVTVLSPPNREALDQNVNYNNASDRNAFYNVQVIATDDDASPLSSTTLLKMTILDINDEKPVLSADSTTVTICNKGRTTKNVSTLKAYDKDTSAYLPLTMEFVNTKENNDVVAAGPWYMDRTSATTYSLLVETGQEFDGQQDVKLLVEISDIGNLVTTSTVTVKVCDCSGDSPECADVLREAGFPIFIIIIIIAILICLIIILAIVVYKRKQAADDAKGGLLYEDEDDVRENLQVYHDEGGGEEDQDAFDITALQQPLEQPHGPRVIDMKPVESAEPQPRLPRNIPGDDIEKYIDDAKAQADKDPTAPPFDSLLVFDYEGTGSDAGSLSSLNSGTTDGSQDYQYLNDWGPRFQNLADMYGQGSDTDE